MGYNITNINGDLAIGRNAEIGCDADIHGKARVAGSLKVEGFLDAPNIKGVVKGLFVTEEELNREYPNPRPGWCAIVLADDESGFLYLAKSRKWEKQSEEAKPFKFIVDSINVFASKGELEAERLRATEAEEQLRSGIEQEATRATGAENNIKSQALQTDTVRFSQGTRGVSLGGRSIDGKSVVDELIPVATTEMPGVMSAEDKVQILNNKKDIENTNIDIEELKTVLADGSFVVGVASLANAVKAGAVTFDMLDGKLRLSASVVDDLETANTLKPLSANQGKVLKDLIDIINGTGEGSTDKKITDAIAKLINKAPENLDTLKELADWTAKHGAEFAAVVADINDIKNDALLTSSVHVSQFAEKINIGGRSLDGANTMSVDIKTATSEKAGVMSAEQVKTLQTHSDNLARLNTTTLNYNRKIGNYAPVDKAAVVANLGTAVERGMIVTYYSKEGWKSIRYVGSQATAEAFANVDNWKDVEDFSAEDKEILNRAVLSFDVLPDRDSVDVACENAETESTGVYPTFEIPAATTETAGVMSAEDKMTISNYSIAIYTNALNSQSGGNIFDKDSVGILVDKTFLDIYGNIKDSEGYNITDYMAVIPGESYCCQQIVAPPHGYDLDKIFKQAIDHSSGVFTIPDGVYWIRLTYSQGWATTFCVNKGVTALPSAERTFGLVRTEKLYNNAVTNEKIANASVTMDKLDDELKNGIMSAEDKMTISNYSIAIYANALNSQLGDNIFDKNAVGILENKIFKDDFGNIEDREDYNISDYMAVVPGETYAVFAVAMNPQGYDINKKHTGTITTNNGVFTIPERTYWIRIAYYQDWEGICVNKGTNVLPANQRTFGLVRTNKLYDAAVTTEKLSDNAVTIEKLSEELKKRVQSLPTVMRKNGAFVKKGDLPSGSAWEFPQNSVEVGEYITFSANIVGDFNALYIGHGKTEGAYMKITANEVVLCSHVVSPMSEKTFEHGLTIENNIQVYIEKKQTAVVSIKVVSNGVSSTVFSDGYWYGKRGTPFVENDGCELADCSFGWTCKAINSDIWAFGDSYFGVNGTIRWMAYLISAGHTNLVVNGFGGQGSITAYTDLTNLLTIGTPKKILWCLGMNDKDSSTAVNANWLNTYNSLKALCENNNIELILATIPTVPSRINKFKNEIVRSSGYRYIDFDKAVGANETTGEWFSDMLSSDGVHPSETGALTLYNRAIADMPELLNC